MKIYVNKVKENWIIDRVRKDWYRYKKDISTHFVSRSEIIWILSPWVWKTIPQKYLKEKKILCSHYHFDFENFDKKDFNELDSFVDQYHVISQKTKNQLATLTDKKITSIPFWINQNNFYYIENKINLRKKLGFKIDDYLIGSFQRDTESKDLSTPKLIKGPDIFIKNVLNLHENNKDLKVILTGKRRQYVIENLKKHDIPFKYFEMVNSKELNELYNILNLYIVSSRIEGGPQAILECAITKTPIVSTDVGLAKEILNESSIYKDEINISKLDLDYAYQNVIKLEIKNLIKEYDKMFYDIYQTR